MKLLARCASLVELTFQVVELTLQLLELLERAAEHLLAGGQVVRDGVKVLRHNHAYVLDGASVGELANILLFLLR